MPTTTDSLITCLLGDHQVIREHLDRFQELSPQDRPEAFCEVVHLLVAHEAAEEQVLYPLVRRYVEDGDDLADTRIAEQGEAEQMMSKLERLDAASGAFQDLFRDLRADVLEHAQAEEDEVFSELTAVVDKGRLAESAKLYVAAKSLAPTHPHPHAPDTPPGNLVAGPVLSLVDHVKDAIRGALSSR
jgi:hemerythrin superfamily protein